MQHPIKLINMENLEVIRYLEQLHRCSASFRAGLTEILIEERYRKHEVIYSPSLVSRIWFVHSGHLYRYQLNNDMKVTGFYRKGSFILCCYPTIKSDDYIRVLSNCRLMTVDGRKLRELLDREPDGQILERLLLLKEVSQMEKTATMIRLPLDQRVRILHADIPEIFQIGSQEVICSYLHMSRESLRKLRKKL